MTREKILALYAAAVESAEWPDTLQGYYDKEHEHEIRIKEAFYHMAQREAFEAAAAMLDTMESEWYDGYEFRKVLPDDCAAAIREMAKESGK